MSRLSVSYQYEMKKLLLVRGGWIFLTCIIALQIGLACIVKPSDYYTFDKKLYAEKYGTDKKQETEKN